MEELERKLETIQEEVNAKEVVFKKELVIYRYLLSDNLYLG